MSSPKPPKPQQQQQQRDDPVLLHHLQGLKDGVSDVAFHPTNFQVAAGSTDGSVFVWDLGHTNVRAYKFCGHNESVTCVTYSPSGHLLASGSKDKTVRLWEKGIEGRSTDFKGHTSAVLSVDFSPSGGGSGGGGNNSNPASWGSILTASEDKTIKMWSVGRNNKFLASFLGHSSRVRCARFSPDDGDIIASVSDDRTLKLFDPMNGKEIHTFHEPSGFACHLDWHPSGTCIGVATSDRKVKIYDIRMLKLQQLYSAHTAPVTQVSFHPSGDYLASSSEDGSLKIFDLLEARPIYDLLGHKGPVTSVRFSAKGDHFVSGEKEKLVFVWKTNFAQVDKDEARKPLKDTEKVHSVKGTTEKPASKAEAETATAPRAKEVQDRVLRGRPADVENKENGSVDLSQVPDLLVDLNRKMDTLMKTIVSMEKRLTLVEDQLMKGSHK